MNNTFNTSLPQSRQAGGLILNVGIGVIFGLLAALLAVYLSTKGGPFKDHANTNSITPAAGQSADPNAPLYGAPAQTLDPKAAAAAAAVVSGAGVGVLTGTPNPPKSATKETAKAVETPPADPVAAVINGNKSDTAKPTTAPAPSTDAKPKASTPAATPAPAANTTTTPAPKPAKPANLPKEVLPATAPAKK